MKIIRLSIVLIAQLIFFTSLEFQAQNRTFEMERNDMVNKQIKARGITHKATLEAMQKVPRHLFIPEYLWGSAYNDNPLPIGYRQTISQPYIVAYMTSLIEPKATDKILEIGTGSGYQAAVLGEIADSVFSVEIVEELAESAANMLEQLGYDNIWVKSGDGYFGWPEHAPFDKIIVTAAAEEIPPLLIEQLKEGGKMILPVGPEFSAQYLILVEKRNGKLIEKNMLPVRFVPFTRDADH